MNEFDVLFKEMDVADAYYEYAISRIPLEDVYMESSGGGSSENFFVRVAKTVRDFIDKIIKGIVGIFDKFASGKACKKAEEAMKADPSLKNKKAQATDWKKVHTLNKEVQKRVQNAKSKEEVDAIMKEYKSKRNKILAATAAVTITLGSALLFLKKGKSTVSQQMEENKPTEDHYAKKYKVAKVPKLSTPTKPGETEPAGSNTPVDEVTKAKATADAEIRKQDTKDHSDEVKENIKVLTDDDALKLKDIMNSSAINYKDQTTAKKSTNANMDHDNMHHEYRAFKRALETEREDKDKDYYVNWQAYLKDVIYQLKDKKESALKNGEKTSIYNTMLKKYETLAKRYESKIAEFN